MISQKMSIKRSSGIAGILGVYFALHFFSVLTEYDYIALEFLFLIFFFFCERKWKAYSILPFVLFALAASRYFLGHSSVEGYFAPKYHLIKYFRLLFVPVVCAVFSELDKRQKRLLLLEIITCMIFTNMVSLYYTKIDPLAIRYRGYGDEELYPGIIRFSQIFSFAMLGVILLVAVLKTKKSMKSILFYGTAIALNAFMLLKAQMMTPVIVFALAAACYILFSCREKTFLKYMGAFLIPITLLLYKPFFSWILGIVQTLESSIMTRRMEALLNILLQTGGQVDSVSARMIKINISCTSFLQKPVFGIGFANFNEQTVGCHQDWFDILAVSGIIGIVLLAFFLVRQYKTGAAKCETREDLMMFKALYLAWIALGFLDPCLDMSLLIVVMIVAPHISLLWRRHI